MECAGRDGAAVREPIVLASSRGFGCRVNLLKREFARAANDSVTEHGVLLAALKMQPVTMQDAVYRLGHKRQRDVAER
ncbi:hypothetical protein UVI_02059650 [Ustilaginoidea virens]|uniref:Uncharacterized protein n=1 Tax=Ustilaginoidea virens TaxID=1159556 RepID=A0A1B5L5L9_USTVR|nr:hypothetical protein UVI_02059650 [Ustilaginoidea virens]